jgi:uncharacterized protein
MSPFARFLSHPIFLSAFCGWLSAQILKSCVALFKNRPRTSREILRNLFWSTGGMPSSHASMVAAVATSVGFTEGIASPLFIVCLFYALLVMRDALGVRRAAGIQAKALNQIIRDLDARLSLRWKAVKEIHGHSPPEVFVGTVLGFFIGVAFCNL